MGLKTIIKKTVTTIKTVALTIKKPKEVMPFSNASGGGSSAIELAILPNSVLLPVARTIK